jgi:hypothetical protein
MLRPLQPHAPRACPTVPTSRKGFPPTSDDHGPGIEIAVGGEVSRHRNGCLHNHRPVPIASLHHPTCTIIASEFTARATAFPAKQMIPYRATGPSSYICIVRRVLFMPSLSPADRNNRHTTPISPLHTHRNAIYQGSLLLYNVARRFWLEHLELGKGNSLVETRECASSVNYC